VAWTDELVLCRYASGADATALGDHDGGGRLRAPTLGSIEAGRPSDNSKVYERWPLRGSAQGKVPC